MGSFTYSSTQKEKNGFKQVSYRQPIFIRELQLFQKIVIGDISRTEEELKRNPKMARRKCIFNSFEFESQS